MSHVAALCQPYLLKLQSRWSRSSLLFCLCTVLCAMRPLLGWFLLITAMLMMKSYKCRVGRKGGGVPWRMLGMLSVETLVSNVLRIPFPVTSQDTWYCPDLALLQHWCCNYAGLWPTINSHSFSSRSVNPSLLSTLSFFFVSVIIRRCLCWISSYCSRPSLLIIKITLNYTLVL